MATPPTLTSLVTIPYACSDACYAELDRTYNKVGV